MVTVEEARQGIVQARENITEQRSEISKKESEAIKARDQLLKQRRALPNVSSQEYLRGQKGASGLAGRDQRRTVQNISKEIESRMSAVGEYEKGLKGYREEVLKPYEQQIISAEQQIAAEDLKQSQYEVGYKLGVRGDYVSSKEEFWTQRGYEAGKAALALGEQAKDIRDVTGLSVPQFEKLDLNKLSESQLSKLESKGYVKSTVTEIDSTRLDRDSKLDAKKYNVIIPETNKATKNLFETVSTRPYGPIQQSPITGAAVVSASTGRNIQYNIPKENIFNKAKNLFLGIRETGKDISKTQANLISAESALGIGGVGSVAGKEVSRISMDTKVLPPTTITTYERQYGTTRTDAGGKTITGFSDINIPSSTIGSILSAPKDVGREINIISKDVGKVAGAVTTMGLKKVGVTSIPNPREFGKRLGDVIKNPSKYENNMLFGNPDVVYDTTTSIARTPTKEKGSVKALSLKEREKYNPISVVTSEQIGKGVGTVVGGVGMFGKYLVPVLGTSIAVSEVESEIRPYQYNVLSFAKAEPVKAALGLAVLGGFAALKTSKYLKSPTIVSRGGESIVTTKGAEFFGSKIKVSGYKDGGGLFSRGIKVERVPSDRYLQRVVTKIERPSENVGILSVQKKVTDEGETVLRNFLIKEKPAIIRETISYSKEGMKLYDSNVKEFSRVYAIQEKIKQPFADLQFDSNLPYISRVAKKSPSGKLGEPKYEYITGTAPREISTLDIKNLPKSEQYLVRETVSKTKGGGGKIQQVDVVKYFKEEERLFISDVSTFDVTKPIGKRTKQYKQFSILKPKGTTAEGINVYDLSVGSKDISKPFSRASGKIPTAKLDVFELPTIDETSIATNIVSAYGGKKTPLSTTFQSEVLKNIPVIKAPTPKPKPTSILPKTKQVETFSSAKAIPRLGDQKVQSAYYGKGIYERTDDFSMPLKVNAKSNTILDSGIKSDTALKTKQSQTSFQKSYAKSLNLLKSNQGLKSKQFSDIKDITKEKGKVSEILKTNIKQIVDFKTGTAQVEKTRQTNKQIVKQIIKNVPRTPTPNAPVPILLPPIIQSKPLGIKGESSGALGKFKVFVSEFGKDVEIGKGSTEEEAFRLLKTRLKSTLRASGFVSKGNKKVTPKSFSDEFRLGKSDKYRLVQKKTRRFGTGSETKEAQFFRKTTKKTKKKKSFL